MKQLITAFLLVTVAGATMLTTHVPCLAQAGGGQPGPTAEAQVIGIQWKRPSDPETAWANVAGQALTVLKGTKVMYKAVKDDPNKPWSTGNPIWSGTSGATGIGETTTVTFTFDSTTTPINNNKTVIVEANGPSSAQTNGIVYDAVIKTTAASQFTGRSETRYGVGEGVALALQTTPVGVALPSITWSVTGNAVQNGSSFTATDQAGSVTVSAIITDGPSKNKSVTEPRAIVQPENVIFKAEPNYTVNKWHVQGKFSVGFVAIAYAKPGDVSFVNVSLREGAGTMTAPASINGQPNWLLALAGQTHAIGGWFSIDKPFDITEGNLNGAVVRYFKDYPSVWDPADPDRTTYGPGQATWPIQYEYKVGAGQIRNLKQIDQVSTSDAQGKAAVSKAGVSKDAALNDPTTIPDTWYDAVNNPSMPRP